MKSAECSECAEPFPDDGLHLIGFDLRTKRFRDDIVAFAITAGVLLISLAAWRQTIVRLGLIQLIAIVLAGAAVPAVYRLYRGAWRRVIPIVIAKDQVYIFDHGDEARTIRWETVDRVTLDASRVRESYAILKRLDPPGRLWRLCCTAEDAKRPLLDVVFRASVDEYEWFVEQLKARLPKEKINCLTERWPSNARSWIR